MKVIFLSSIKYQNVDKNCGDCIIVDNGSEIVVYDCGCVEHAARVEEYMKNNGYAKAKIVLSHNDSDHFDGIGYLLERGLASELYTLLLFKYTDELLDLVNDKRRTKDSIIGKIKELYSNIASLSGKVVLKDILGTQYIADGVKIVGPDKSYALHAVAKYIDSRQGDTIDNETIMNAVCAQVSVVYGSKNKLLLTGDSSFNSIENELKNHNAIQLPHHGKEAQAEEIFSVKGNDTIYYISDNTGNTNGGSKNLKRGHIFHNTKDGDQICDDNSFGESRHIGSYFWHKKI